MNEEDHKYKVPSQLYDPMGDNVKYITGWSSLEYRFSHHLSLADTSHFRDSLLQIQYLFGAHAVLCVIDFNLIFHIWLLPTKII